MVLGGHAYGDCCPVEVLERPVSNVRVVYSNEVKHVLVVVEC